MTDTPNTDLHIQMLCDGCKQWQDIDRFPNLRACARGKNLCIDCIAKKGYRWIKRTVVAANNEREMALAYKYMFGDAQ